MNDTNDTSDQQNTPQQPDDAQKKLAGRVMALYGQIDETLNALRVPARDRKDVEKNLMEAIGADLLVRLGSKMNEEQREELMGTVNDVQEGGQPDLPAVAAFFNSNFDQEELLEILAESTESVLNDFVKEMSGKKE
ncbi:MAG: hypothetical protein ACE5F4_01640 [Candidatus Paceibacteria bacterium]